MREAIYALSADPITYGHIDIVNRALRVFDKVIVGIGNNVSKKYTFSIEERVALARKALNRINVEVVPFEGLLVDFAYSKNIRTIIRGVRNSTDFAFEQILHDINYGQRMGIDTFLIIADQSLSHVSSSAVKELQAHSAKEILEYVPMSVKQALEERMLKQVRIGVTGEIGAGKSFLVEKYKQKFKDSYGPAWFSLVDADLDRIAKDILLNHEDPVCADVRREISSELSVSLENGKVNIQELSKAVFSDEVLRCSYNDIMLEPILYYLRRDYLSKRNSIVIISGALLADANGLHIVNNNVILVTANKDVRRKRLKERNYGDDEIERRMNSQLDADHKRSLIEGKIKECQHGSMLEIDNSGEINAGTLTGMNVWIENIHSYAF
jgi:pantetheine-phosphate adenylyltransferase